MRCILQELSWSAQIPDLAHLIRREDIPRAPQRLPRALTPQQDQLIQQELLRRNDLPSNVLLLMRHTGMRIGECVDLAYDCLHNAGPDLWAIHVPLGKLKTERMVPVDSFVCELVHRLRFFRSFDPLPFDGRLLARPRHKQTLVKQLRSYLPDVVATVGIPTRIVPHQLRHTYASEMVRAGVGLPALMKLLGHVNPEMTMRYVDVAGTDLQREFHLARSQPRHLPPQPKARARRRAAVWTASSIRCCSPNMPSRCSVVRCRTALPSIASISSAIDSPKSSRKPANSNPPDSGQRLAV
jgi:integrase